MLLFWKLIDETQMSTPPKATRHHNSTKLWLLLPLRALYFSTFQYETPCSCANCKLKAHIRVLLYYTIENFAGAIHAQGRRTVWKSGWGKTSKRKRFHWFFCQNLAKWLPLPSPWFRVSFTNILRYLKTGRKCRPPGFFQGKTAGGQVRRTQRP